MVQHRVRNLHIQRRRQAELQFEVIQPIIIDVLRVEQLTLGVVQRLPSQIDLEAIDASRLMRGLELFQTVTQCCDIGKLIANDLRRLQYSDVTTGRLCAGAAGEPETLHKLSAPNRPYSAEAA